MRSVFESEDLGFAPRRATDNFKGVAETHTPPTSPSSTQVQGALSETQDNVQASPTPLEGKDAYSKRSMEASESKGQLAMATPTIEEDNHQHPTCRIVTPKIHPASWSVISSSSVS